MRITSKNALKEALNNPKSIKKIYLSNTFKDQEIMNVIKNKKVHYEAIDSFKLNKMEANNQGLLAIIDDYEYYSLEDLLSDNIIVMLDHLEDPHNLGAIIRTVEAAGIKSIIIPISCIHSIYITNELLGKYDIMEEN